MIDRDARGRLTELIVDTIHGRVMLGEYLRWSSRSEDRAIGKLHSSLVRRFSDGHFDKGNVVSKDDVVEFLLSNSSVNNTLLFLRSDLEYEWPARTMMGSMEKRLWKIGIGSGRRRRSMKEAEQYRASGEIDVWPFIRRADLEKTQG